MFDLNISQLSIPLPENTDVVDFSIKVNGQAVPDTVEIYSISVQRGFNRIAYADISILDGGVADQAFPTSDTDTFSPGKEIEILAGYMPEKNTLFKGIIIRHAIHIAKNGRPRIDIVCKDIAVRMTVGRKNKYYFNDSDAGIIERICRQHNVEPRVENTSVIFPEMVQYFATDWDFIVTRAESNGKLVLTQDGELVVKSPDFNQSPKFAANFGTSLYEFEAEMDARDQYPSAKATAWDPGAQTLIESETSPITPPGDSSPGGFADQAASAVGGAIGADLQGEPPNTNYTTVMGLDNFLVQHSGRRSQEELENWAMAQFLKSDLAAKKGRVKFLGTHNIYPGEMISLQGVGSRHSGNVFITAIKHEILEGSWFTHAQFGLPHEWLTEAFHDIQDNPAANLLPGVCGLQVGIVTKLEQDPEGEYRIQVRLPVVDAQGEGIWARIASQDAGENRGAFWLPELEDEVIVGFINDDPRDAIVLGMLYSSAKPAPLTAMDQNNEKGWVTRSGIRMIYDDDKSSWLVETPAGKKVSLDDEADTISLEDQHGNKIILDSNGISIESAKDLNLKASNNINVEGLNINQTASATITCEGNSSAEISAAGQVVVKGGIVQIN